MDAMTSIAVGDERASSCSGTHIAECVCHCCGKMGHIRPGCPLRNERCRQCNRVGHVSAMCAFWSRIYRAMQSRNASRVVPVEYNRVDLPLLYTLRDRLDNMLVKIREMRRKRRWERAGTRVIMNRQAESGVFVGGRNYNRFSSNELDPDYQARMNYIRQAEQNIKDEDYVGLLFNAHCSNIYSEEDLKADSVVTKTRMHKVFVNGEEALVKFATGIDYCLMSSLLYTKLKLEKDLEKGKVIISTVTGMSSGFMTKPFTMFHPKTNKKAETTCVVIDSRSEFMLVSYETAMDLGYMFTPNVSSPNTNIF